MKPALVDIAWKMWKGMEEKEHVFQFFVSWTIVALTSEPKM